MNNLLRLHILLLFPVVVGLFGCSSNREVVSGTEALPAASALEVAAPDKAEVPLVSGVMDLRNDGGNFTPLPSAAQVLKALPVGRDDPFAPVEQATEETESSASLLPEGGIRLLGLMSSGREDVALISIGGQTGHLCRGVRGLCVAGDAVLLPLGWIVEDISLSTGSLTLVVEGKKQVLRI